MALRWTHSARSDLVRLHEFLHPVNVLAAVRVVRQIVAGVKRIPTHPRLSSRLAEFEPREVRRAVIGDYEIRDTDIFILRIVHVREDR